MTHLVLAALSYAATFQFDGAFGSASAVSAGYFTGRALRAAWLTFRLTFGQAYRPYRAHAPKPDPQQK